MAFSLRLNDEDSLLIKKYAELHNISVSDLFRQAVMEKIENEYDLKCYENAIKLYNEDKKTYSLDEVKEELGLI